MNPELLDLKTLPSVLTINRNELPNDAGIYFLADKDDNIQYIGMSKNINNRWVNHHRLPEARSLESSKIAYLVVSDTSLLPAIEQALINYYQPPFNGSKCILPQRCSGKKVTVVVPLDIYEELQKIAEKERRSIASLIVHCSLSNLIKRAEELVQINEIIPKNINDKPSSPDLSFTNNYPQNKSPVSPKKDRGYF